MPAFGGGTIQLINAYAEGKQWDKGVALTKQYKTSKNPDTETLDALYLLYPDLKKKMETVSE